MGKEAKIGLGVILVLSIILGGVLVRRLSTGSSPATAQTTADEKEKTKIDGEFKAGKTEVGSDKLKPEPPRVAKELPKMVSPASPSSRPPKSGSERDLWNIAPDYRDPMPSAGEAATISAPPSMMPEPPTRENADPNDRYASNPIPASNRREAPQNHDHTPVGARDLHETRSYTVAEGDTLFDIARYELGKASRWAEIYELNRDALGKNFDYLVPGSQLALPQDSRERSDPVARLPVKDYRR